MTSEALRPHPSMMMPSPAAQQAMIQSRDQGRGLGFTGNFCPDCGQAAMVRNGSCEVCTLCGATTGCS